MKKYEEVMKKIEIVITRHPGLVEFLKEAGLTSGSTEVLAHATPENVRGKHVCGVLPHSLSCLAASVTEVPINLPQELSGVELTLEQVRQYAGAPVTYRVSGPASFSPEIGEIAGGTSTNGRWGIKVVGPEGVSLRSPQEGKLSALGTIEGHKTFQFIPEPGCGQWVIVGGELTPLAGCEVVVKEDLQSSTYCTVLVGGEFFAVTSWGYKGRSSTTTCYYRGQEIKAPAAVLAVMGIIPCTQEPVQTLAPALPSPLAAALAAAGLS